MGTHNSYHIAPPPAVIQLLELPIIQSGLGSQAEAVPGSWEVTQANLTQQLENYGARAAACCCPISLDVHRDRTQG